VSGFAGWVRDCAPPDGTRSGRAYAGHSAAPHQRVSGRQV